MQGQFPPPSRTISTLEFAHLQRARGDEWRLYAVFTAIDYSPVT